MSPIKILLIDDDEDDFVLTRDILSSIDHFEFALEWEMRYINAFERIIEKKHDIYLIDYRLGENDGISLIRKAVANGISIPMILLTGKGDHNIDIAAMREGAADYLVKGEITPQLLERSIRYALNNNKSLQMLKEGENKFRQLFERSIDAIYIADMAHCFRDVNPSLSTLLGYPHNELIGKCMACFFEDQQQFQDLKKRLEEENQIKDFSATLLNKNGKPIDCQITSIISESYENTPDGFQGIIHDITLTKKTEKELLIAEKLSMTGKLARSIAHEVRNPLSNVQLALDQLKEELSDVNSDTLMFYEIIHRNTSRISQLITEMLNSSKPKELHKVPYSLNKLVEEALMLVDDRLTLKGMKLSKDFNEQIPEIMLDVDKLKIAILNVLVNAIEAMEDKHGILQVKTGTNNGLIMLEISDNGYGISSQDLSNLFDPFYTNKQEGMGLGLTSTQAIIHSHKGSIQVNSEERKGTCFIISLPYNPIEVKN